MRPVRDPVTLLACLKKNGMDVESAALDMSDVELLLNYIRSQDARVMVGADLDTFIIDRREDSRNTDAVKCGARDIVAVAIDLCKELLAWVRIAPKKDLDGPRSWVIQECKSDMKRLTALELLCS